MSKEDIKTTQDEELNEEQLDQVSGGAAYIKYDWSGDQTKNMDAHHDKWIDVLSFWK